jgi:hypothetical protein
MPQRKRILQKTKNGLYYAKSHYSKIQKINPPRALLMLARAGIQFKTKELAQSEVKKFLKDANQLVLNKKGGARAVFFVQTDKDTVVPLKVVKGENGNVLVTLQPYTHGIARDDGAYQVRRYTTLLSILRHGFKGTRFPNVTINESRRKIPLYAVRQDLEGDITHGDLYSIEMLTPAKIAKDGKSSPSIPLMDGRTERHFVESAPKESIISVNVKINPNSSKEDAARKREYYQNELRKLGVQIKFI